MKLIEGRAFRFGDDVNTDVMAPGLYFKAPMAEMARHCLEAVDPQFASTVRPGDIIVAGRNFGVGSAREQAALALTHLQVGAVLAVSFGRIFYRNALNFGLPALVFPAAATVEPGDRLRVDRLDVTDGQTDRHQQRRAGRRVPGPVPSSPTGALVIGDEDRGTAVLGGVLRTQDLDHVGVGRAGLLDGAEVREAGTRESCFGAFELHQEKIGRVFQGADRKPG